MELIRSFLNRDPGRTAVYWSDEVCSYGALRRLAHVYGGALAEAGVERGAIVALRLEGSPAGVALLLAAIEAGCIVVPLDRRSRAGGPADGTADGATDKLSSARLERAQVEMLCELTGDASDAAPGVRISDLTRRSAHPHYRELRRRRVPGLVLFTSGSSGRPKAAVHDLEHLLSKFSAPGKDLRTLLFFYLDHISGLDTLFYALSNGSSLVVPRDRTPESVCRAIEQHSVEVLPTSPSFLNLMILGRSHQRFDLSSLAYITYGGEVMPGPTLERLRADFPGVRLSQKYGSTELGTLRVAPESSQSLWFRVVGEGTHTRVVDGVLQIRSNSAMLGYLEAEDPFTADGWFDTRDEVVEREGYLRVLGRLSEVINVGGEKVYPARVESVLLELDEVADAVVHGEQNPVLGNIVCARIVPAEAIDKTALRRLVQTHCRSRLQPHEVPVRVSPASELELAVTSKKARRWPDAG